MLLVTIRWKHHRSCSTIGAGLLPRWMSIRNYTTWIF